MPMRLDETIAIAALMPGHRSPSSTSSARANQSFRHYSRALIMENKWRAARYGLDGKMIDFGKQTEVPARDLIGEILEFVDDVVDELGSREEINYIHEILEHGNGADRQLRVFSETGDLKKVVDYMIEETEDGLWTRQTPAGESRRNDFHESSQLARADRLSIRSSLRERATP